MTHAVLDLDDVACHDVEVAGGKAAWLSRARSVGLPALPGYVVTTSAAMPAIDAGNAALATRGSGGGRLAAQATPIGPDLVAALTDVVARLGAPVIVRSSATVEGSGEWSGAFSSFADIDETTVVTATKGCWASLFSVDALERAEHSDTAVDQIALAVLLQPMVVPRVSGHARVVDTTVEITAVEGSPAGLMSGWVTGSSAIVTSSGAVSGPARQLLTDEEAQSVAAIARRCDELLGQPTVEWAIGDDAVILLQSSGVQPDEEPLITAGIARLPELDHPYADRVAQLVRRFPGGLSDGLVLPWALGIPDPRILDGVADHPGDLADLAALQRASAELADFVWADTQRTAGLPWRAVLRDLRSDQPGSALGVLGQLRVPPYEKAAALLRNLTTLGAQATMQGSLRRPDEIFGCELSDLEPSRALHQRQSWAGARRWEPFLAAVTQTRGTSVSAQSAAPGVGAGAARLVTGADRTGHATHARSVIVAVHPIPGLAPLLWNAAGLVTTQGSNGAHLIEVARSLGVPAVVQCADLPLGQLSADVIIAVDGDAGQVSWHLPQAQDVLVATP